MKKAISGILLSLVACLLAVSCSHPPKPEIFLLPDADISQLKTFYVVKHQEDTRGINDAIAGALKKINFEASTGPESKIPVNIDVVATYQYHWWWDFSNYLNMLKIYFKTPSNNSVFAKGSASRTSSNRQTKEEIAAEIVEAIFTSKKQ